MKHFIWILLGLSLHMCCPGMAQTPGKIEDATIMPGRSGRINYVKNPSALYNPGGVAVSSATISRSTAVKYNNVASFECNTSANGGYCEHLLNPIHDEDQVGDCSASFNYLGDGTLYSFQLLDGSSNLLNSEALTNVSKRTPMEVTFPCGSSRKVRITQTTAGTSPAINYALIDYGKWTGGGSAFIDQPWESFTPVSSWTANTTHTGRKRCIDPYNMEVQYKASLTGAPTSAILDYDPPAGVAVDTSNLLTVTTSGFAQVGDSITRDISPAGTYPGTVLYLSTNKFQAGYLSDATTPLVGTPAITQAVPITFASGDSVLLKVKFPTTSCGHMQAVTTPNNSADLLGTIFYEESATCPANSIKVNGSTLNATTHAQLIARRTAKGIASPTVLPNLSGLFIRSAGTQTQGGVAHTAGALGAFQADQMQGHIHPSTFSGTGGGAALPLFAAQNTGSFAYGSGNPSTDGSNGTPRTGTTTRPANMAFTPCMWFVSNPAPLIASSVTYSDTVRAEGVNGNTTIAQGSYTPAITPGVNVAGVTPRIMFWKRNGKRVSVNGFVGVGCTAGANTQTAFKLSLPIASTGLTSFDLSGPVSRFGAGESGIVYGSATTAEVIFNCNGTSNTSLSVSFEYDIK